MPCRDDLLTVFLFVFFSPIFFQAFGAEEHVAASSHKDVIAALVVGCSSSDQAVVLACVKTLRTM